MTYIILVRLFPVTPRSGGGRVVKLLACRARGPGFDYQSRHLNFQRLIISFQVHMAEMPLKRRKSSIQPTESSYTNIIDLVIDHDLSSENNYLDFFVTCETQQHMRVTLSGVCLSLCVSICLVVTLPWEYHLAMYCR